MEAIRNRRSVRQYKKKTVEDEKIMKLLGAAMQAPSAGNQRPWEFIVLRDKEKLQKLSKISPYANSLLEADVAILVLGNQERMKYPECWQQDLGAASQNILLEAVELELGAVWLGVAPIDERIKCIKDIFSFPENIIPFSIISIGYPHEKNSNKFIDRFDETRIHFEDY